jgi:small-conductance mechanosensitive channel
MRTITFSRALAATFFVLWALFSWAGPVWAQASAPDYANWQSVAERAETAVEAARASDDALTALRAEVVDWRVQFQAQLSANDNRLQTLREQIASLGSAPEEGATEADEIAARRAELSAQLERLSTPRRTADEAFSRANGIVTEIDEILRQRQADQLLNMGPWPVNPVHWGPALRALNTTLGTTWSGVRQAWSNPVRQARAQDNLPLVIVLLVVGGILLSRSRHWSERMASRIQRGDARSSAGVAGFVVSLGQIIFPMLGLLALVRAIGATGLYGPSGGIILQALEPMGLAIFFARWLATRMFPKGEGLYSPLVIPAERRLEGRIYAIILGVTFAFYILLNRFSNTDRYDAETSAVLNFPLIVLAGLLLLRTGWVLRRNKRETHDSGTPDRVYADRLIGLLGQGVIAVGVLAPTLAALGYSAAAEALIYPTILTLALFGTIALLQRFVRDIYAVLRPAEGAAESLIPTLISFALVLCALPLLALIWGARVTDLTELWTRLRSGLTIGGTTISPGSFLTLVIVFVIGYLLTRGVQGALKTSVLPKTRIDPGGQVAVVSGLGYVGIFLAAVVSITAAGIDLSNLAIVAGALSVGIGFGLQTVVSNFVSGIILLIERPISEGDWIEVGGQMGYVRDISVRSTRIETFDRTDVIVPNADLISGTVTNYTRGNTVGRVIVPVGVAYGTDTRRVETILQEIANAHPMTLATPPPTIIFAGFGADSLDFEIRMILRDVNWMIIVKSDINHAIAARFKKEGIEIPFAQRDLWLRNPEALRGEDPA